MRNVLFILTDDQRYHTIHALGNDESFKIRKELYFAYGDLIRSAKDERYKLIQYRYQKERCQLFDLWEDPDEQVDLSMYPEYQVVIKRLKLKKYGN